MKHSHEGLCYGDAIYGILVQCMFGYLNAMSCASSQFNTTNDGTKGGILAVLSL